MSESADALRTQTGDVARSLDAIAKIEKGIKKARDAQGHQDCHDTGCGGCGDGAEITFGYNDLVLPGAQPEFGKQTMELARSQPFGEVKVNGDMDGGFGRLTDGLDAQTRRIAMFCRAIRLILGPPPWRLNRVTTVRDPWPIMPERLINERIGITVYKGEAAFSWKGIKGHQSIAASSLPPCLPSQSIRRSPLCWSRSDCTRLTTSTDSRHQRPVVSG